LIFEKYYETHILLKHEHKLKKVAALGLIEYWNILTIVQ